MEKTTDPLAEQEPDIPEAADGIDGQEGDNLPIESNTDLEEEQRGRIAYNFRVLDDKRDLHTFLLSNDNQESKRYHSFRMFGLFMAFFVVCVALGLGAFLIISGHSLAGLSSLLGGLGFLAGIFIFSKRNVFGSGTSILKQAEEESKDKNKS